MKRTRIIALGVIVLLFILALIPAFYPVEDDSLRKDCPFWGVYGQLFAVVPSSSKLDVHLFRVTISPFVAISYKLPQTLRSSAETRAPPLHPDFFV